MNKKKINAVLAAAVLAGSSAVFNAGADTAKKYKGDIDLDGSVSAKDVMIYKHCITKTAYLEDEDVDIADINKDDVINVYDEILAKRIAMGIIEPIEIKEENPGPQSKITINDMPSEYQYAADWIWQNRVVAEQSTVRRNTIFDQIIAGNGTLNYVVKWQSYKTVTLEQRRAFETMLENAVNDWTDWLVGYENWPYDHIDVKIVGWAVIDKNVMQDLQPDEIVYDTTIPYDSSFDTSNGVEEIPNVVAEPPAELSRLEHFSDPNYEYPGGLDKRFDMCMWATQGFPAIGGCGGDWGQRLSDNAYLNMIDGSGLHVFEHELGHGFGMTDFYGGEGEKDGFPPGGFPGGENSLMMAGSAMKITDFDGWELRYFWTKIKDEDGRFPSLQNQ